MLTDIKIIALQLMLKVQAEIVCRKCKLIQKSLTCLIDSNVKKEMRKNLLLRFENQNKKIYLIVA